MRYGITLMGTAMSILLLWSSSVWSGDGVPSQAKLSQLGLGSLTLVSDDDGKRVRAKGFGSSDVGLLQALLGFVPN